LFLVWVFVFVFVEGGSQVGWETVLFARKSRIWVWDCGIDLFGCRSGHRKSDHLLEFLFRREQKRQQDEEAEDCCNPSVNFMVGDQSLANFALLCNFYRSNFSVTLKF
jgi:hypothetical protein